MNAMTDRSHTVVEGDTLWALAERYYGDGTRFPLIAAANGIADPNVINVGQVLAIPDVDLTPVHVPVFNGRPPADFAGALPYASEIFGVYQPLAGWFGQYNTRRTASVIRMEGMPELLRESFAGNSARTLSSPLLKLMATKLQGGFQGVLSPVGLVT